ncbi:MAG: methyl-accepting chemotaxis protein [Deltaproteobacteria bacterium]
MKSLRQKVTIVFSIILIICSVTQGLFSLNFSKQATDVALKSTAVEYAKLSSKIVEKEINLQFDILKGIANQNVIKKANGTLKEKIEYVNQEIKDKKNTSVGIIDGSGIHVANTNALSAFLNNIKGYDFYQSVLAGKSVASSQLLKNENNLAAIIYAVPISYDNGTKGAVVAVQDVSNLTDTIKQINYGKSGNIYILDKSGNNIVNKDRNLIITQENIIKKAQTNSDFKPLAKIHEKMILGEFGSGIYNSQGIQMLLGYSPINGTNWSLAAEISKNEVKNEVVEIKYISIAIDILLIIIGVIIIYFIAGTVTSKLKTVVTLLTKISSGDFTSEIPPKVLALKDEVGEIAKTMDVMQRSLSEIMLTIKDTAGVLAATAEETSATTEEIASSSENQSAASEQTLSSMEELDASVQTISSNIKDISGNINHVTELIEKVETMMEEVASSAEEVSIQSENSLKATDIGREAVYKTQQGMDEINEAVGNLVSAIKGLGKSAVDIGEIVDVIDDIAEQTNLLALNAAIEAARAGEHGKGFAVVAGAIRNLAEKSGEATKEITKLIRGIQDEVGSAVETAKEGAQQVEQGVSLAQETKTALVTIREAVDKAANQVNNARALTEAQAVQMKEVTEAAKNVNELSNIMASTVQQQSAASSEVVRAVRTISESAAHVAGGTGDIAASTDSLAKEAQKLTSLISEFKLK